MSLGPTTVMLLLIGVSLAVGAGLFWRRYPAVAVAAWATAMFLSPVWVGASVGFFVTALEAVTMLAIVAVWRRGMRFALPDAILALFVILVIGATALRAIEPNFAAEMILTWMIPYVWGRVVLSSVPLTTVANAVATLAVIAAALAILEFATGTNLFHFIPGASGSSWGDEQFRAGLPRSEGAFGHSIALGGTLAMSVAFVLVAQWPVWLRVAALALIGGAVAVTFSRLGLVTFALTAILALIVYRDRVSAALRWSVLAVMGVGAVVALPVLLQVFGDAGSEAEGSAQYRSDLFSITDSVIPIGSSPDRQVLATGQVYYAGFRSIDNAVLLSALRFGAIPVAILLILLLSAVVSILRGRGNVASVALVCQAPAFTTVALITQYTEFVWFAAGLAVACTSAERVSGSVLMPLRRKAVLP